MCRASCFYSKVNDFPAQVLGLIKQAAFAIRQVGFRARQPGAIGAAGQSTCPGVPVGAICCSQPEPALPAAQHLHPYDLRARVRSGNELEAEASTARRRPASEPLQPLQEEVLQPPQRSLCPRVKYAHLQLTVPPPAGRSAVRFSILFHSAIPRQRHVSPHPSCSTTDYLGRNSGRPVLGPSPSPMLSLGTKCKSVAVPASIKNFKNRTKQTEKDFHNNLKIH